MPRELITIQVGQCGNQIGRQFWKMALDEHAHHAKNATFDESMGTFFRNVDKRGHELPLHKSITSLRARAILVDMEEGPVSETLKGPLGELFDSSQFLTDVSGSGNNWDSLQSFFVMHSMGGGTGSGLGTYILGLLEDHYPEAFRFTTGQLHLMTMWMDDSMLALRELTLHADCVLPIENEALYDMLEVESDGFASVAYCVSCLQKQASQPGAAATRPKESAFDQMNSIVARTLTHLTSSMRFDGSLNVDLNEITTNLVPFPKLHYLLSSVAPLWADKVMQPRRISQMFSDAFQRDHQLIKTNPKGGIMLACGLLLRGNVQVSDIQANIQRLRAELRMIPWNEDGFKVGLCSVPALGHPVSLLSLSNNSCIVDTFERMHTRFLKLYKRKAHVHHYLAYMDTSAFDDAVENVQWLVAEYRKLNDTSSLDIPAASRPKPLF
ncbi:hypothetical protein B5M09_001114 [Aphanomyces astaci]|uniref:Tubulin/FtsZ GTPase domain-containing protein n=1 Tax=Aphanomyces astaci TaxID=112090 RepID=A0A3R7ZCC6_APHAT|nr:hypothetical protein B5M09_001114 [Aphanomyces astaci]